MTPTRTPANSTVARFHPNLHHPHPAALLMLVITAIVVTLGARFTAPNATATTTDKTFETDDHVITQTQNGTITIIDKKTQIAVQDTVDPAATGPTEKELAAQADGLAQQFKNNLGWDLDTDADRTRLLTEARAFSQQLHNIPEATLNLKGNSALRTLRDIVDGMDGTKTCRERCLVERMATAVLVGVSVAHSLRILRFLLAEGGRLYAAEAVATITVITGLLLSLWSALERDLRDMPEAFRLMIRLAIAGLVGNVYNAWTEVIDYVAHSRTTLRHEVTDAAQHLDTLTPDDEPATDFDLAKDEL